MSKKSVFIVVCLILSIYTIFFSFYKINLPTADIGRHITNGKIFLNSSEYGISKSDILYTNFFSYTYPTFPFVNHHWLSGIASYIIFSIFGFSGLSVIYFLLIIGALVFALYTTKDESSLPIIFLTGLFLIPLIADRTEVRPEGLSYLLLSLFIFILYRYNKNLVPEKALWILPFIQLLWVNTHIYFIFGIFLVGVFFFENLILRYFEKAKKLFIILLSTIFASVINPYFIKGVIYPFTVFQNYGYKIVENQSISFLENLSFQNPSFLWYKITLVIVVISSLIVLIKNRKNFPIALFIISITFAVLGYSGIRHIPAFALVSLSLIALNISTIKGFAKTKTEEEVKIIIYTLIFFVLIISTFLHFENRLPWNREFGLGIDNGDLGSAKFIVDNNIRGPIFNNYDIGGMLIFSLFPKEKVFVDNRPEAYPKEFFEQVYIPMQEDDNVWNAELKKENFNVIYFYRLDYTPWSQKFLISRVSDENWAPVFVDNKTIIFLRRNEENKKVIEKYELPKSLFGIKN